MGYLNRLLKGRSSQTSQSNVLPTIAVDQNGTALAYIDTGAPRRQNYATIFAIHGIVFTSHIFDKVAAICLAKGVRFVAINRRSYQGSTPFTTDELSVITSGTDDQKAAWLRDRGTEYANFMSLFIEREKLPAPSTDGKSGGIALVGWSAGATYSAAVIASIEHYAPAVQDRLSTYLRAHIMQDPPSVGFGLPLPPKIFSPQIDPFIPADKQSTAFVIWITSYFQHGDLASRDVDVLEYVLPSLSRAPTIWNMTATERADIIDDGPNLGIDTPFALNFMPQTLAVLRASAFNKDIRKRFPRLQIWEITGDAAPSFGLNAFWSIQDEATAHSCTDIHFKMIHGINHFGHWDDPDKMVDVYSEALA